MFVLLWLLLLLRLCFIKCALLFCIWPLYSKNPLLFTASYIQTIHWIHTSMLSMLRWTLSSHIHLFSIHTLVWVIQFLFTFDQILDENVLRILCKLCVMNEYMCIALVTGYLCYCCCRQTIILFIIAICVTGCSTTIYAWLNLVGTAQLYVFMVRWSMDKKRHFDAQ